MPQIELFNADSEKPEFIAELKRKFDIAAVLADPPYGGDYDTDYSRFSGGVKESNTFKPIVGDNKPFDPTPWLELPKAILWGSNLYADKLPLGTTLVWLKKRDNQLGEFLSDCELAWMKGGKGVYLFKHVWHGFDRDSERGRTLHATQKPVALMRWCLEKLNLSKGAWVLDPYMGSAPVGKACMELGLNYIGIEIDQTYFDTAQRQLQQGRFDWSEGLAS